MSAQNNAKSNILGTEPVGKLILKFAVPSIIAMLVSSLYNMVDQIFIGNFVGALGNAATNIAFPFSTMCIATALLFGIGGSASFNLACGAGDRENAGNYIGNALTMMFTIGTILALVAQLFMEPMLMFFGSPGDVLPYAVVYTRVTSIGFPFLIISTGGGHLIRADGKPTVAMTCNLVGAITNTILDALFVAVFKWGMAGAAVATVIGQIIAFGLVVYHIINFRTVKLTLNNFIPKAEYTLRAANLGMSQGINQVAMMIVQIVLNNSLRMYGAKSVYGESIPIAVVGVVTKVAILYFSFCIGISQALQPIVSFNYGAKQFKRTKEAILKAMAAGSVISILAFILFQTFPREITSIFGGGNEEYFNFAIKYFRIYLFFTFVNNIQPIVSNYFSAIGKPVSGMMLSLTRQILFLLPMIILLPIIFGIEGIMYAGPVADGSAFLVSIAFLIRELRKKEYSE